MQSTVLNLQPYTQPFWYYSNPPCWQTQGKSEYIINTHALYYDVVWVALARNMQVCGHQILLRRQKSQNLCSLKLWILGVSYNVMTCTIIIYTLLVLCRQKNLMPCQHWGYWNWFVTQHWGTSADSAFLDLVMWSYPFLCHWRSWPHPLRRLWAVQSH